MHQFLRLLFFLIFFSELCMAQLPSGIFKDSVFAQVTLTSDIVYGGNINHSNEVYEDLLMDTYVASDSINFRRPLLIYLHGGGFTSGDKATYKAKDYGQYFATRGYLVASLNYRLSENISGTISDNYQSVFQAVQDAKSAIRYFKKNADEYCLDTAAFFVTGTSAGGSISAMVAYWDQEEADQSLVDSVIYGTLDAGSGNEGYSNSINGIVICWGATTDTTWLKNETEPNLIFHGTNDQVIPYTSGYNVDSIYLYGGKSLYDAGMDYGIETTLHPFYGAGHGVPKNSPQFDTIFMMTTEFMYKHLPATTGSTCKLAVSASEIHSDEHYSILSPNPCRDLVMINLKSNILADQNALAQIFDVSGKLISSMVIGSSNNFTISCAGLKNGMYFLQLTRSGNSEQHKLIVQKN